MKKILFCAVSALAVNAANAGIFVAPTMSVGQAHLDVRNHGDDGGSPPIDSHDKKFSMKGSNFGFGFMAGYDHAIQKGSIGFHVLAEINTLNADKKGFDTGSSVHDNQTYIVKMRNNVGAGVHGDYNMGDFAIGAGLRVVSSKFSVQSFDADNSGNYTAAESKRLTGFEPTLRLSYKINNHMGILSEVGYAMYQEFKAKDNYEVAGGSDEKNYVNVKPKILSLRLGFKYSF